MGYPQSIFKPPQKRAKAEINATEKPYLEQKLMPKLSLLKFILFTFLDRLAWDNSFSFFQRREESGKMFFCRTSFFASFKTEIHSTLHVTASNLFQVVWNACRVVPVMTVSDCTLARAVARAVGSAKGTEKAWPRV